MAHNGPHNGRKGADTLLMLAIASGKTAAEAAEAAGVSRKTATRRLKDPLFRRRVNEARDALVSRTIGCLADGSTEAAQVLRDLLRAQADTVKLGAARAILEMGTKLRDGVEFEERLAALEARILQPLGGKNP